MFAVLKEMGSHIAMTAVKTWCNAWTTSTRYHDGKCTTCIFGCRWAPDHVAHYMSCARLWVEVEEAAGLDVDVSVCEVQRLLIDAPSPLNAAALATAFSVYHSIKNGQLEDIQRAERGESYDKVLRATREAVQAYAIKYKIRTLVSVSGVHGRELPATCSSTEAYALKEDSERASTLIQAAPQSANSLEGITAAARRHWRACACDSKGRHIRGDAGVGII